MPALTLGGAPVKEADWTRSWGVTPASASVSCPGGATISVDDEIGFVVGGSSFFGRVTGVVEDRSNGLVTRVSAADNRLMLHRDDVYGTFNNIEVIEDDPATPGIDRKKRFWHILPDDWEVQRKTYTTDPLTAAEILNYVRTAPTVDTNWIFDTHSIQAAKPVFGIDANNGAKLGNVLHEISEKQGLVFTLIGAWTLTWARKGEGTLPSIPTSAFDRQDGEALSNNDTLVRVVGDRNQYQVDSVTLEPDWNNHYADYWLEAAWIERAKAIFGLSEASADQEAALFARAKSATMREYCEATSAANADRGMWGEVSRMELPVWVYLQDVVFKAYRIPSSLTIGDNTLESLELVEGLLVEMDYSPTTGALTKKSGGEPYPGTKALIVAQGQQVGIVDPQYQKALTPAQIASARNLWQPITRFSLDTKNKVVIFEEAVIRPGTGAAGLFVFPNVGVDGTHLTASHPAYNLAVPNAAVTIQPAPVKASLTFEAERYFKEFGSGNRRGPHYCRGLRKDVYMIGGSPSEEIEYADDQTADEKAADLADGLVLRQSSYASGGWKRRGTVGTALNPMLDRVTVRLNFTVGIQEEVEYTKERAPLDYFNERDLDRKQRQKELFPGQDKNKEEVWMLRQLAKVGREQKRNYRPPLRSVNDVVRTPVGAVHSGQRLINDPDSALGTVSGGQPIITSKTTGKPIFSGAATDVFAGIAVADGQTDKITIATQGVVPVRIKGPVVAGAVVAWKTGQIYAAATGTISIGTAAAAYAGTEVVLLPVRLGGGGASRVLKPLEPFDASAGGDLKITINWGTIGGLELDDFGPTTITETTYFFGKMTCDAEGNPVTLEKHTQTTATPPVSSDTVSYHLLGRAVVAGAAITAIEPNLQGSQSYERCGYVGEYTHHIELI